MNRIVNRIPTPVKMGAAWAFLLLMVVWPTVESARAGKPAHTLAGILGTAAVALFGALTLLRGDTTAPQVSTDGRGLRIAPARTQQIVLGVAKLLGALALVIVGYLQFRHQISWAPAPGHHHSRRGATAELLMPILLPVIGAVCLALIPLTVLELVEIGEGRTYLRLQPDGVELAYSARKQRFLRWEDIADIPGGFTTAHGMFVSKVRFTPTAGKSVEAPLVALAENSTPVNALLRFYLHNPAQRGELATGEALRRYRTGDYRVPARAGRDTAA